MKPVTHYPFVNHRNILSTSPTPWEVFSLPEKIISKIRGTTDCKELDVTKKIKIQASNGNKSQKTITTNSLCIYQDIITAHFVRNQEHFVPKTTRFVPRRNIHQSVH
jgi:hypothetical protein